MRKHFYLRGKVTGSYTCRFMQTLMILAFLLLPIVINAQVSDLPALTIKTLTDTLRFKITADDMAGFVEVDDGSGIRKKIDMPQGVQVEIEALPIAPEKTVKVYADPLLLNSFYCVNYGVTELDLSGCANMIDITCNHNFIEQINVSKNTKLQLLNCGFNKIKTIDLSQNPELEFLYLQGTAISSINVGSLPKLRDLLVDDCPNINSINVSSNPLLERLGASFTNISSIDVTKNPNLVSLDLAYTKVTKVDVTKNTKLAQFSIAQSIDSYYKVSSIDVTNNPELYYLSCSGNNLKELDISKNPKLFALSVWANKLTEIDISNNPELHELIIRNNNMTYNTMPLPCKQLTYYIFSPQNDMLVEKEYAVGTDLDLTESVYNPRYQLDFRLYLTNSENPNSSNEVQLVEGEDYTVNKGKIHFLKAQKDSVYCQVLHEMYPEMWHNTTKFLVLNPEDMGKYSLAFEFSTTKNIGDALLLRMSAFEPESKIKVDFGDGQLVDYTINNYLPTSSSDYILGEIKGESLKVYTASGVQIKQLVLPDGKVNDIRVNASHAIQTLDLSGNELTGIDLSGNFKLMELDLDNNQIDTLLISDNSQLRTISCNSNRMKSLELKNCPGIISLTCSDNELSLLDVTGLPFIENLDATANRLTELNLLLNENLSQLRLNSNMLESIDLSRNPNLKSVWIADNNFRFSTLPETTATTFIYNNQKQYRIPSRSSIVDLSSERIVKDKETLFIWKTKDGKRLYEDDEYTISDGITKFLVTDIDSVYCEMTNSAFPSLILKTTCVKPAGLPGVELARLELNESPGTSVNLNMAAKVPSFVYVDFGDGELTECRLQTEYQIFERPLGASQTLTIYGYDEKECPITVLSIFNISMKNVDVSKLVDLYCLNLSNTGLKSLDISKNIKLEELILGNNRFSEIDLSNHSLIRTLDLSNNRIESISLNDNGNIEHLLLSGNSLNKIDLSQLAKLRTLSIPGNNLDGLDLSNNLEISQISVQNNKLESIILPESNKIDYIDLSGNSLRLSTLPVLKGQMTYVYAPQLDVDVAVAEGKVDLSGENVVNEAQTTFVWKTESGIELAEGTDYTITDGVTTFLKPQDEKVYCEMTNATFPKLTLKTVPVEVGGSGIDGVQTNDLVYASNGVIYVSVSMDAVVTVYGVNGQVIRTLNVPEGSSEIRDLQPGIYMISVSKQGSYYVQKVIVE